MGNALGDGRRSLPREVQAGYKRTEVGVIPEEWDVARIDQNASIKTGSKNTQDKQDDGDYPFFVRSQEVERISSYSYDGEAVLTAGDGVGTGKVFHYIQGQFDVHQRVYRITDFSDQLNGRYFFYQFSTDFYNRIMSMTAKSSVDSVRLEMIAGMQIPLPPPDEQRAIAEALSDVDGLLAAVEALIVKKRAIKQAAMQQLLTGKTRLPGFSGEWTEKPLIELVTITMGQSPPSMFYNLRGEGLPLIQGNADIEDRRTIDRVWTTHASKYCDSDDLLLTVRAPVGAIAVASKNACLGRGVCGLKPIGDSAFLFHALVHAEGRWQIFEQGSTFTAANSEQVGQFRIRVSSDENEQSAIAAVLSDMDAEIAMLERRRNKIHAIKQGMMQQLLTGRVRLVGVSGNE